MNCYPNDITNGRVDRVSAYTRKVNPGFIFTVRGVRTCQGCQDLSGASGPLMGVRTCHGCQDMS